MQVEWNIESDVVFLIKTMKKKHLHDALSLGEICFSCPKTFSNTSNHLNSAQEDNWDSQHFFPAQNLYCYPILEDNDDGIKYDKGFKIANKAVLREINDLSKRTPLCSFRKVTKDELVEQDGILTFSLGNTVDRIKNEFGHDSFILIACPGIFLERIEKIKSCYGKSISYGNLNLEEEKLIENYEKSGFPQIKMFQKRKEYDWQKEYRVILSPTESDEQTIINIGSIEDIAFGGDLETLRLGYGFGKTIEDFEKNKVIHK